MKKLAALALALSLAALPSMAEGKTFTGEAHGNNGRVSVQVTLDGDRIASVEANAPYETPGLGLPAVQTVAEAIVEQQTLDVDVVTGATVSSLATIEAAENALVEAGVDVSAYVGADKREDAITRNRFGRKIKYRICRRPSSLKKLSRSGGIKQEKRNMRNHLCVAR